MQNRLVNTAFRALLVLAVCAVGYLLIGNGLYFWKEHVHHYRSGARSHLLALRTMQENYRTDHDHYAKDFSELGVPLGARLQGDELLWDGPYGIRFTRLVRDQNGAVAHYTLEAQSRDIRQKLPTLEIDDAGILKP